MIDALRSPTSSHLDPGRLDAGDRVVVAPTISTEDAKAKFSNVEEVKPTCASPTPERLSTRPESGRARLISAPDPPGRRADRYAGRAVNHPPSMGMSGPTSVRRSLVDGEDLLAEDVAVAGVPGGSRTRWQ